MSDEFTMAGTKGFNTSMFFNNTIDEVKQQMNLCGLIDYGSQFDYPEGRNLAITEYQNIYYSYENTIFTFAIDCLTPPLGLGDDTNLFA